MGHLCLLYTVLTNFVVMAVTGSSSLPSGGTIYTHTCIHTSIDTYTHVHVYIYLLKALCTCIISDLTNICCIWLNDGSISLPSLPDTIL